MTTLVNTNKTTWFQNEGEPLKSGFIYVGEPNQDPRSFDKDVTFTDDAGNSFTASQPLRTNNDGRIVWNGKAIEATVNGDYSLLVLNSNQTQINDGYIASVMDRFGDGSVEIVNAREYGLNLEDTKKLDKTPGQTVGSIGKVTAQDTEGANWLVVSNTGGAADDVDLIDFDNGTQGQRLRNFLQPQDNLDNLASNSSARSNLDVYSTAQTDSEIANAVSTAISDLFNDMTTADGVGSTAFLENNTGSSYTRGQTINASTSSWSFGGVDSVGPISGGTPPTGIWRCMGVSTPGSVTVFTKISN